MAPHRRYGRIILLAASLLLTPVMVALANGGPPPTTVLLTFDIETAQPVVVEGIQLIECDTQACSRRTLLQQHGVCDAPGCVQSSPEAPKPQESECLGNRCLVSYYRAYREGSPPFAKIVVQFTDGLRESEVFSDKLPAWGETAWRVTVNDSALIVTRDASREALFGAHSHFVEFFALTMVTELAVAAVVLGWGFRARGRRLSIALAYVALANLLSYPVTRFSWPAMAQFQPDRSSQGGRRRGRRRRPLRRRSGEHRPNGRDECAARGGYRPGPVVVRIRGLSGCGIICCSTATQQ